MRFSIGIAGLLFATTSSAAQLEARVEIALPPPAVRTLEGPFVRSTHVFSDSRLRELLHNGFPARLHHRLELWSTRGWFDDRKDVVEWDLIARYSPLERRYALARVENERVTPLGSYGTLTELETAIARPYQPSLRAPSRRDRFYYTVALDVAMLSVNDLDEVERWLRGELRPAVRGQRNPGTAVTRGVRELVVKLLGGEERHYEARSEKFRTG